MVYLFSDGSLVILTSFFTPLGVNYLTDKSTNGIFFAEFERFCIIDLQLQIFKVF
jgi:hypothetical protein